MTTQHTTERMIQEYVPGKQVTLAHVIANPGKDLFKKLGLPDTVSAIGILKFNVASFDTGFGYTFNERPLSKLPISSIELGLSVSLISSIYQPSLSRNALVTTLNAI